MLIGPVVEHFHNITDRSGFVIVGDGLAAQGGILAFKAVECVAVQEFPHVRLHLIHDSLDAEEIARDINHLIIAVEERGQRKPIAEDQDNHCEREPKPPVSKQVSNEDEDGVDGKRRFPVIGYIDHRPFQAIPGSRYEQSEDSRKQKIKQFDLLFWITRLAKERDHRHKQRILDDGVEHERRNHRRENAAERSAQCHPEIELREVARIGPP